MTATSPLPASSDGQRYLLMAAGACGRRVDRMCTSMYESNQPPNHYNRLSLSYFGLGLERGR